MNTRTFSCCRPGDGLFPAPKEIGFACSCPDWASTCKHVAAVLYGIGARLDERPEPCSGCVAWMETTCWHRRAPASRNTGRCRGRHESSGRGQEAIGVAWHAEGAEAEAWHLTAGASPSLAEVPTREVSERPGNEPTVYFTPVIVIPATNCRRASMKAITSGALMIVAAALSAP